jgi:hypothetical protein
LEFAEGALVGALDGIDATLEPKEGAGVGAVRERAGGFTTFN